MQTVLDISPTESPTQGEWLVRLSAGMPGGIGNTGHECGAVTSPLVLMGVQGGLARWIVACRCCSTGARAVPRFRRVSPHPQCREIRGKDHFPRHCIGPVLRSAELWRDALDGDRSDVIPEGTRAGYAKLYSHFAENGFHCAKAVLVDSATPRPNTRSSSMPRRPSWAGRYSWEGPAARSSRA